MPANSFLGVFAKSPLKPLENHVNVVNECSKVLTPFFQAAFEGDWEKAAEHQQKISQLEKQADDIKHELRINLPSSIFMPVHREDLLELLTHQDQIANMAKDVSGLILGRQLTMPEGLKTEFMRYLARCLDATQQATNVINELDDLLETGFKGREVKLVETMIQQLDMIEDDTDSLQIALRKALWQQESQLNPVDVMFLYKVFEGVGELANIAQRVGARLELTLAG